MLMLKLPRRDRNQPTIVIDGMGPLLSRQTPTVHYTPVGENRQAQLQDAARRSVVTSQELIDRALSTTLLAHTPVREFQFTQRNAFGGALWHAGADYLLYVKGLPEKVLAQCELTENEREAAVLQLQKLSGEGYIVVAIAKATLAAPVTNDSALDKQTFAFVGFVSFSCRIDRDVQRLIRQAVKKGRPPHLITGAHTQAAFALASQLGLVQRASQVCDARQLHVIDPSHHSAIVYARALPRQKNSIVAAIQAYASDTIVASTKQQLIDALDSRG